MNGNLYIRIACLWISSSTRRLMYNVNHFESNAALLRSPDLSGMEMCMPTKVDYVTIDFLAIRLVH